MKIVFYTTYLGKGGAERVLLAVAEYIKGKHEVVIATDTAGKEEYKVPEGIRRIVIGESEHAAKQNRLGRAVWRLGKVRKLLKEEKADIVISFMESCSIRAICSSLGLKTKSIATVRMNPAIRYNSLLKKLKINFWFGLADTVICQTGCQKLFFSKRIQKKTVIIPNPISDEFAKGYYDGSRKNRIVTVGRVDANKNQQMLIEVFAGLSEEFPEYIFDIYGRGVLEETLQKQVNELGLENRIFLRGNSNQIREDIKDAKVFAFASKSEGMPNVILEAMAVGVPVISTRFLGGAAEELIENGKDGILVNQNDIAGMLSGIRELLMKPELAKQYAAAAREKTREFQQDVICMKWEQCIQEVEGR